jgi:hypothetical protein
MTKTRRSRLLRLLIDEICSYLKLSQGFKFFKTDHQFLSVSFGTIAPFISVQKDFVIVRAFGLTAFAYFDLNSVGYIPRSLLRSVKTASERVLLSEAEPRSVRGVAK